MNRLTILAVLVLLLAACGQLSGDALIFKTASPDLSIGFRLLPAPPAPPIAPAVAPEPTATVESLVPTVTPTPCLIAGNINAQGRKLYHTPDSPQYGQVKIDEAKGERWFCSPEEAEAAGWTKAGQ